MDFRVVALYVCVRGPGETPTPVWIVSVEGALINLR